MLTPKIKVNKVGIIVPYRNRWEHYTIFKKHIERYLFLKKYEYSLIIIEQDNARAFNRGKLCNIGFLEAKSQGCSHVVFHDIDMLPLEIDYSYSDHPVHLISEDLPFDSYFGGITLFPTDQFEQINGFSNLYWGWGFEDDDLRYRCIKNSLNLIPVKETYSPDNLETTVYNGWNSYSIYKNTINVVRDFEIEIKLRLGEITYNHKLQKDDFVIFNIEGNDFKLKYTSFKRFYLEVFDKKNQLYSLNSEVYDLKNFIINIKYYARLRTIEFYINNELVGKETLNTPIFNYNKTSYINVGSDHNKKHKFKGAIDSIKFFNKHKEDTTILQKNVNVDNKIFTQDSFNFNYIPYRRKGKVKKLSHPHLGFKDGVWQDSLTRWNQLKFNNEVLLSTHQEKHEGLSNCRFKLHHKERQGNYTHLKVKV